MAAIATVIMNSVLIRVLICSREMYLNIFDLIIFAFLLGAQIFLRFFVDKFQSQEIETLKIIKIVFLFSIVIVFSLLFYQSYLQYRAWSSDELSKHLLYQETNFGLPFSVNYFVFYVGSRFFAPYLISLIAASVFLLSAQKLNKKYEERFFEPEEPWLGALAFFLLGHPAWLFYFVLLILFYFLLSIFYFLLRKKQERIPFYYLWMPTAIFVIIIKGWLETLPLWKLLIF